MSQLGQIGAQSPCREGSPARGELHGPLPHILSHVRLVLMLDDHVMLMQELPREQEQLHHWWDALPSC